MTKKKKAKRYRRDLAPDVSKMKIEKGVPIRNMRLRTNPYQEIFLRMKNKDSFTAPMEYRNQCMTYARYFKDEHGGEFASRVEEDGKVFRIWYFAE